DGAVVLDAPGIDAALAQRADQFAAGGTGDQELVALRLAPDDLDQLGQVVGIGEVTPRLVVGAEAAIVLEIVAVDLVRQRLLALGARAAQPHHLGEDRKSTRLNSSHVAISYAVFCLKKKTPSS